jgi:hypothetical protein
MACNVIEGAQGIRATANNVQLTPQMVEAAAKVLIKLLDASPYWARHVARDAIKAALQSTELQSSRR